MYRTAWEELGNVADEETAATEAWRAKHGRLDSRLVIVTRERWSGDNPDMEWPFGDYPELSLGSEAHIERMARKVELSEEWKEEATSGRVSARPVGKCFLPGDQEGKTWLSKTFTLLATAESHSFVK
jgi:hypothetical protein